MSNSLPSINPIKTKAWEQLNTHYNSIKNKQVAELFKQDSQRADTLKIEWKDFYIDYSKNRIDATTVKLLVQLAKEVGLDQAINSFFNADTINVTENRAVQHIALRNNHKVIIKGKDLSKDIQEVKDQIKSFSEEVINGNYKGYTGKTITDIVNIGIGGSDLGPYMITEALAYYKNHLNLHYISNVDGDHVHQTLKKLNPETTLFIVVSKSFSTQETLSNALTIREWFLNSSSDCNKDAISKHFVAVSSNIQKVVDFGISPQNIFPIWDWVGGRFSLWSAVGLSIVLGIGFTHFEELLEGAMEMDTHFKETNFEKNIPVLLGLLSIWYGNFFGCDTEAVIPYCQYLHRLPAYLQQGIMESNGKSTDRNGNKIDYQTGTIIWGEPGTNAQHAFFQLIHQGTRLIPSEFIGFKESLYQDSSHHNKLMANFFAQTEALMKGKNLEEVTQELQSKGLDLESIKKIAPYKIFEGNKPTTSILINKLTPKNLGALVAMYEHRIFVQGIVWNIYSFDQWGVELGKQLAGNILAEIDTDLSNAHDASTNALLKKFLNS